MKKIGLLFSLLFLFAGCHTMNIKNGEDVSMEFQTDDWHHIGILRLVEFSDSVALDRKCAGKQWESVQTRTGPLQVLVHLIPYVNIFYAPEQVRVACKQ